MPQTSHVRPQLSLSKPRIQTKQRQAEIPKEIKRKGVLTQLRCLFIGFVYFGSQLGHKGN